MQILRTGAAEMKEKVDEQTNSGLPLISLTSLVIIFVILLNIWKQVSEQSRKSHLY